MSDKKALEDKIHKLAEEGRITFAEELDLNSYPPEFINGFFTNVLGIKRRGCYVSIDSSLYDFGMPEDAEMLALIEGLYKVDVSDLIDHMNLKQVLDRCCAAKVQ